MGMVGTDLRNDAMAKRFSKEQLTAFHEAGHAAAAWHFNMPITSVSIIPNADDGSLGKMLRPGVPDWFQPDVDIDLLP